MKNQYFGDINDFWKFGLLRVLADGLTLGVCWMLTADDGRMDGTLTSYLTEEPSRLREFDPALFDTLRRLVGEGQRDVRLVETHGIVPAALHYTAVLGDQRLARLRYVEGFRPEAHGCTLVFFDPDNGMEVPSTPKGRKDSSKYLYWDEFARFYARGHSLLVYQHFRRVKKDDFIRSMAAEMIARTQAREIVVFHTAQVAFFLAPQAAHLRTVRALSARVASRWGETLHVSRHWLASEGMGYSHREG